ncbi:hypothetical protein FM112_10175 [Gulosibacter sp. 10]|nr:hypothetical protein FM112_10175 [Gulosibacter sp. 10]
MGPRSVAAPLDASGARRHRGPGRIAPRTHRNSDASESRAAAARARRGSGARVTAARPAPRAPGHAHRKALFHERWIAAPPDGPPSSGRLPESAGPRASDRPRGAASRGRSGREPIAIRPAAVRWTRCKDRAE